MLRNVHKQCASTAARPWTNVSCTPGSANHSVATKANSELSTNSSTHVCASSLYTTKASEICAGGQPAVHHRSPSAALTSATPITPVRAGAPTGPAGVSVRKINPAAYTQQEMAIERRIGRSSEEASATSRLRV